MIGTPLHLACAGASSAASCSARSSGSPARSSSGESAANTWVVTTPDGARRAVREVADSGYDFVKLTSTSRPRSTTRWLTRRRGGAFRVVGHVDPRVGVARALAARQQIEHLDNYMESVLADSRAVRACVSDVGAYRRRELGDARPGGRPQGRGDRRGDGAGGRVRHAHARLLPPLVRDRADDEVRGRPDYAHIPPKMRDRYERARARYWQNPPSDARRARYIAVRNRMVKAIVDSGGYIMAGSDAPGGLMGYGWTLHRELEMLVDAGLTPLQALAAATRVPARGSAPSAWGARPGRRADLVLLDADPLRDIRNTTRISAVMSAAGCSSGARWMRRSSVLGGC